uniref:Uncharacterized protein n=1 Tax=Anguilla anguilla TaxID=7936 RepID=A0A0E9R799_ANGAN
MSTSDVFVFKPLSVRSLGSEAQKRVLRGTIFCAK